MFLRITNSITGKYLGVWFACTACSVAPAAEQTAAATEDAATEQAPVKSKWNGAAELGLLTTRGNTETDSLNLAARVENTRRKWHHKLEFKALQASEQDNTTAESYEAMGRSEFLLDDNDYLFGLLRYQDDRFSGYDQRTTEVFGYGHQYLKRDNMKLKGEFGVGARQTENTDGTKEDEGILRVGLDYNWKITKTSSFNEEIFVEHSEENTATESITELTLKINSQLATKIGVTVKNNSDPPAGVKNTDTKTAVTLVYDF